MIFERAADQADAVGEQRRGQRIAGVSGKLRAVEVEAHRVRPVDQTAFGQAIWLRARRHHSEAPGFANSTATISWVLMLRVTTSQAWQPAL